MLDAKRQKSNIGNPTIDHIPQEQQSGIVAKLELQWQSESNLLETAQQRFSEALKEYHIALSSFNTHDSESDPPMPDEDKLYIKQLQEDYFNAYTRPWAKAK